MIPKILHFIWVGKDRQQNHDTIEKFKSLNPDFKINYVQIDDYLNSNNEDVQACMKLIKDKSSLWHFFHQRRALKYLAGSVNCSGIRLGLIQFCDVFRLYLINKYGGIYLDLDIEPIKAFDEILLNKGSFCTSGWIDEAHTKWFRDCYFLGCEPGYIDDSMKISRILKDGRDRYQIDWRHIFSNEMNCYVFPAGQSNEYIRHLQKGEWHRSANHGQPQLIVLNGKIASGKTTFGMYLSTQIKNSVFVDVDACNGEYLGKTNFIKMMQNHIDERKNVIIADGYVFNYNDFFYEKIFKDAGYLIWNIDMSSNRTDEQRSIISAERGHCQKYIDYFKTYDYRLTPEFFKDEKKGLVDLQKFNSATNSVILCVNESKQYNIYAANAIDTFYKENRYGMYQKIILVTTKLNPYVDVLKNLYPRLCIDYIEDHPEFQEQFKVDEYSEKRYSKLVFGRYLIFDKKFHPEVERFLYVDCDVTFHTVLDCLFDMPINGISMRTEIYKPNYRFKEPTFEEYIKNHPENIENDIDHNGFIFGGEKYRTGFYHRWRNYCNSGVIFVDRTKMPDDMLNELHEISKLHTFKFIDQDILNIWVNEHLDLFTDLPATFNDLPFLKYTSGYKRIVNRCMGRIKEFPISKVVLDAFE